MTIAGFGFFRPTPSKTKIEATGGTTQPQVTLSMALNSIEKATRKAFDEFVVMVEKIPSVEQVRGQVAGTYLHLVVYASNCERDERFLVYEAEQVIHDRYPSIKFEFDLIDRRGYPMEEADIEDKYIKNIRKRPDSDGDYEISQTVPPQKSTNQ